MKRKYELKAAARILLEIDILRAQTNLLNLLYSQLPLVSYAQTEFL